MVKPNFDSAVKKDELAVSQTPSFTSYVKELVTSQTGLTKDNYDNWLELGATSLTSFTKNGTMEAVSKALTTAVGGTTGTILGVAVDAASRIYDATLGKRTVGDAGASFDEGQWVAIDNGTIATDEAHQDQYHTALRRRMMDWESIKNGILDFRGFHGGYTVKDITIGFYIGDSQEPNMISVFNFGTLREEDHMSFDVGKVDKDSSLALDSNPFMSKVKERYFFTESSTITGFTVPTDPGTEVIYNGELYTIERSVGQQITIKDVWGQRKLVDLCNLKRGKVMSNVSYNYGKEGEVQKKGFTPADEFAIHAGQVVWVNSRLHVQKYSTRELLAVSHLTEEMVHGFYCLDGEESTKFERDVVLLSDDFEDLISRIHAFQNFRELGLAGHDMKRIAPGHEYPLLCVGAFDAFTTKQRQLTEFESKCVPAGKTADLKTAGKEGLVEMLDNAAEKVELIPGATAQGDLAMANQERPQDSATAGSVLPMLGIAGVAFFLLNAIG